MTDGQFKPGYDERRGRGRKPGVPERHTRILREAFILAAEAAGGGAPDGLVKYLTGQAHAHPVAFLAALAKVLPLQIQGKSQGNVTIQIVKRFDSVFEAAQSARETLSSEHKAIADSRGLPPCVSAPADST